MTLTPLHRRVLSIIHAPVIPFEARRKLPAVLGWNDPDGLAAQFSADVREASHGLAEFEIVERLEVDGFPVKQDGFVYTPQSYLACWRARGGFHQPDAVDYHRLLAEFDIIAKINSGAIDEVWLFGFPYAGYYESLMAGPGAFWCNAPPLGGITNTRRFILMGFNYERGVGEMLEDLGHRAESILGRVFAGTGGEANLWGRFTRHERSHPGRAECGNVHFAPNSLTDYDWGNRRPVLSRADAWNDFPDLTGPARLMDCAEWGGGDIRAHHQWWFRHFPHVAGESDGLAHNWWAYVLDPNRAA